MRYPRVRVLILVLVVFAALVACSPEETRQTVEVSGEETTGAFEATTEGTVQLSTTPEITTEETTMREGVLDPETDTPDVVLRLEGDPETSFSGLCDVEGRESVLSGRVPKRFTFRLGGAELSCEIQKQDERGGNLRVTLLAGNSTRSIQQTNAPGGTINITYNN